MKLEGERNVFLLFMWLPRGQMGPLTSRKAHSLDFNPCLLPTLIQRLLSLLTRLDPKCRPCAQSLHRKSSFPLRISSVNVTKSADSCGFSHLY